MQTAKDKLYAALDEHFSKEWRVVPLETEDFAKRNMHRTFVHLESKWCFGIQYAVDPGNKHVYLPLVNPDGTKGWPYTTHAQVVVYYIQSLQTALLVYAGMLKTQTVHWMKTLPTTSFGDESKYLLVPIAELARLAYKQEFIPWE